MANKRKSSWLRTPMGSSHSRRPMKETNRKTWGENQSIKIGDDRARLKASVVSLRSLKASSYVSGRIHLFSHLLECLTAAVSAFSCGFSPVARLFGELPLSQTPTLFLRPHKISFLLSFSFISLGLDRMGVRAARSRPE